MDQEENEKGLGAEFAVGNALMKFQRTVIEKRGPMSDGDDELTE